MKRLVFKLISLVVLLSIMPAGILRAETEAKIMQVYISEQTLTVFVDMGLLPDALRCSVSSQNAEITATGSLSDDNALIKTTILLDGSTSMPNAIRNGVIATLKELVGQKSANEEFKLVVFGTELKTIHEFSSDRYDLASAIEQIMFDGNQSKIYDAIYNTIPPIASFDEKPTFYRTIAITDGADNAASGITKEELFLKLQNEHYPIDIVAVSNNEKAEDKELSAIVRMSGGKYHSLNPDTDIAALAQNLNVNEMFYLEARIPTALLDGAIRQIDIGDGVYKMSVDIKIPVYSAPWTEPPTQSEETLVVETTAPPATSAPTIPPPTTESEIQNSIATIFGDYTIAIFIGAGIALIGLIAVIAIVSAAKGKKKKNETDAGGGNGSGRGNEREKTEFANTEYVGDEDVSSAQYTIKLSNLNNPSQNWTLPISGEILIGRADHCLIRFDDISVSREQCKIVVQGSGIAVIPCLEATNKTILNGSSIAVSLPLQSGDTLKFGRISLRIDYIQSVGNPSIKPEQPQTADKRHTDILNLFFRGERYDY